MRFGEACRGKAPEQQAEIMPKEVPAPLQHNLAEKIELFWFRQDRRC